MYFCTQRRAHTHTQTHGHVQTHMHRHIYTDNMYVCVFMYVPLLCGRYHKVMTQKTNTLNQIGSFLNHSFMGFVWIIYHMHTVKLLSE